MWEALADHWPRIMKLLRAPEAPAGEWLVRTAQELSTVLEYASLWDRVWFSNEEEEAEGEEEEERDSGGQPREVLYGDSIQGRVPFQIGSKRLA